MGKLGVAMGAYASVGFAVSTLKRADAVAVLDQRIRSATKATGDYKEVSEELLRISQANGVELASTVDLYQRLSFSAEALGASSADILNLSNAVQQLGVIGGTTKQQMDNALLQFSQMLGQSKPQAEELNSILDAMPLLARKIEKGLNLLPGSLKTAVREGRVLTQDVFDTLLRQAPEIAAEFAEMPLSIDRASTMLGNSWDQFIRSADVAVGATEKVAAALKKLAEILDGPSVGDLAEAKRLQMVEQLRLEYEELGHLIATANNEELKASYITARERTLIQYNALMDSYIAKQKESAAIEAPKAAAGGATSGGDDASSQAAAAALAAKEQRQIEYDQRQKDRLAQHNADIIAAKKEQGAQELEAVRMGLLSEEDVLMESYMRRHAIISQNTVEGSKRQNEMLTALFKKSEEERTDLAIKQMEKRLEGTREMFGNLAFLANNENAKLADIGRSAAIVTATMDGFVAAQKALAQGGAIMGPIMAASIGIMTAANIAGIAGARATGGPVSSGSSYLVGERGPEMFTPSVGGNITPNNKMGGDLTVNIIEDASRAGTTERTNDSLTVFVAAAIGEMNRQINTGGGIATSMEKRYGLNRSGR
jgi:tape measure domain-containing protein